MEPGNSPLPAKVTYDRLHTAFREITPETFDWDALLDTEVLFVTGITAALTETTATTVTHAVEEAARRGVKVALDVNYRGLLWSQERAREVLEPLLDKVSILFCSRLDGIKVLGMGWWPTVNRNIQGRSTGSTTSSPRIPLLAFTTAVFRATRYSRWSRFRWLIAPVPVTRL